MSACPFKEGSGGVMSTPLNTAAIMAFASDSRIAILIPSSVVGTLAAVSPGSVVELEEQAVTNKIRPTKQQSSLGLVI